MEPVAAGQPGARPRTGKLKALLASKLATARAWDLKECLPTLLALQVPLGGGAFWTIGVGEPCAAASSR